MKNFAFTACLALLAFVLLPIHASSVLPAEELFKTPYYSNPKLTPDGKYVIGKLDDGQKRELVITDVSTQQRYPVVFFAKRNYLRNFFWIDSDSIYIEYISGKKNKKSIVDIDLSNLAQKSPTKQVEIEGYLLSPLPDVNDEVMFVRNLDDQNLEIYQLNTADLVNNDFSRGKKIDKPLENAVAYSYDDKNASYFGITFDEEKRSATVWFLAPNSEKWLILYDSDNLNYQLKVIQYLSDNKFLTLTNKNSERMLVAIFDLATRDVEKVVYEHPQHDIINAEADKETGELLSVTYLNRGSIEIEYLQREQADFVNNIVESEDDDPIYTIDTSEDGSKSILYAYGAAHPGTYIYFDENKQSTKLIEHVYPNLIEYEFAKTRLVEVPLASGEVQEGFLTIPYLNGNGTLLVLLEPGRSTKESLTEFSRSVQYLASRGYAVLRLNYRSPLVFAEDEKKTRLESMDINLESNINQLVKHVKQQFNYQKTCSIGSGYGAYSALRLAMLFSNDYQCVISLFGIYDFQLLFSANNAQALKLNQQAIKDLLQSQDSFVEQSPVYLADGFDKPMLMVAGEDDDIAILEQFNRMKYVLQKNTDKLEHYVFTDTNHGVNSWFDEQQIHAVIDEFLRRKLDLPPIESLSNKEEGAKEYIKISDMFSFDTLVTNDPVKSLEYLTKASALGHPRAMFNHGAHYHRGELVDESIEKAIEWYKKSSAAGYAAASFRLGELYENNSDVEQNLEQAYQYFLKADQQGFDARAGLKAAKYVCTGDVVKRDVDLCMKLFDIYKIKSNNIQNRQIKVTKKSKHLWRNMLAPLMLNPGNTAPQQVFYKKLLQESFGIVDVKTQFELVGEGLYSSRGMNNQLSSGTHFNIRSRTKIGIRFKLHRENQSRDRNAVIFRVLRTSATEDNAIITQKLVQKWGDMHDSDWFLYTLIGAQQLFDSSYELQIYNLDAELLYSQTFHAKKKVKNRR